MLVLACLMTSTYFESMVKVVSCRTYNVDRCASPLMLQKSLPFFFFEEAFSLFFFIWLRVSPGGHLVACGLSLGDPSAHGNKSFLSCATSWCLNRLT